MISDKERAREHTKSGVVLPLRSLIKGAAQKIDAAVARESDLPYMYRSRRTAGIVTPGSSDPKRRRRVQYVDAMGHIEFYPAEDGIA